MGVEFLSSLKQWFLSRGDFAPVGKLAMLGDISECHNRGVVKGTDIQELEARDAAKHPPMHSTFPHNREVLGANVNSYEVEKLV